MEQYLRAAGELVGWAAEVAGIIVIAVAVVRGIVQYILQLIQRSEPLPRTRIRLSLGRSLALALEFLLAADIVRTALAPTWDDIGKLAAIATIRTGLNFFLAHEIEKEGREIERNQARDSEQTDSGSA